LEELTRDRRTSHFLDVKIGAKSLGIHPNKFSEWVYRTGEKIKLLYRDQPGLMAAQMALWAAEAEADKQAQGPKLVK
jgi:hypothetical protein